MTITDKYLAEIEAELVYAKDYAEDTRVRFGLPTRRTFSADTILALVATLRAERAENARLRGIMNWRAVADEAPPQNVPVLAYYLNSLGNGRRVRATYYSGKELVMADDCEGGEYDEETESWWMPAGWYETNEEDEHVWQIINTVTHWMPLPPAPTHADTSVVLGR